MFRIIKKIFVFVLLIGIVIGGYFYFFPVYSNSHIPEGYFSKIENDQQQDVKHNGYFQLQKLFDGFTDEEEKVIEKYGLMHKCLVENQMCEKYMQSSQVGTEDIEKFQKGIRNSDFTSMKEVFQKVGETDIIRALLDDYLVVLEEISEKNNFKSVGYDEGGYIGQIHSMQKVKDMYYILASNKKAYAFAVQHYNVTSKILQNQDIDFFIHGRILNSLISDLEFFQYIIENGSPIYKKFIKNIFDKNLIIEKRLKDIMLVQYQSELKAQRQIYEETPNDWKKKFFYDINDSERLLGILYYSVIEKSPFTGIKNNGKNLIGRMKLRGVSPQGFLYKINELHEKYEKQFNNIKKLL